GRARGPCRRRGSPQARGSQAEAQAEGGKGACRGQRGRVERPFGGFVEPGGGRQDFLPRGVRRPCDGGDGGDGGEGGKAIAIPACAAPPSLVAGRRRGP